MRLERTSRELGARVQGIDLGAPVNEVKPRPYAGAYRHTDLSYEPEPAFGSVMYAVEVPDVGGDTIAGSAPRG